ncbi:MAG TPA: helix-turn-helix transcriptional regulator [Thiobacillaceae bacterium]|nr:helix-turn-helix transcriptional regulator [Thiobacillaceae bacterium]
MSHVFQDIAKALKAARESKGLSQRALSEASGVLQTRISKIENGAADFRVSTLMALARALDLELTLVPRKAVSAVQSVVRASEPVAIPQSSGEALKELQRIQQQFSSLTQIAKATQEYAQFQRHLRDLQHFKIPLTQIDKLKEASKALDVFRKHHEDIKAFRRAIENMQSVRNAVAHAAAAEPPSIMIKPAYTLDDEDNHA